MLISHVVRFFFIAQLKLNNIQIQYSVPSIAEIDMTSSGSGYERHLTIPLTAILLSTLCTMAPFHFGRR